MGHIQVQAVTTLSGEGLASVESLYQRPRQMAPRQMAPPFRGKVPHVPIKTYQMATETVSLDLLQRWRSLGPERHVYAAYNWLSTARMAAVFQSVNPVVLN